MRVLPPALQAALDSGASRLARCWKVTRRDGVAIGFTDHDRDLTFDGVVFEANSGLTQGALDAATGLAADTHEVTGALSSDRITDLDVAKGLYHGAEVAHFLVDWTDPATHTLLFRGQIGEIRRAGQAFEAEVTGLADRLNQPLGRAYLHSCDCRLGEGKCGIDLSDPAFLGTGTVADVTSPGALLVTGLDGFANGWFIGGNLTWSTGGNAGLEGHVKSHVAGAEVTSIELWLAPPVAVQPGDTFEVTAGCDKTAATCRAKFDNILNFRGFPHMPGDDVAASYPNTGGAHNGRSLFR
ncbi:MAG: DUF2163 domain-containing protein [Pseudomonadota bacterium]